MQRIFFNRFKIPLFLFFLVCFQVDAMPLTDGKIFVVVLDAGHGGRDSGNRGNGYYEKKIALSIVLKIGEILERDPNIKVIYTRKTDVFLELSQRADIANKADADLFISVHCDSFRLSKAFGAGTFVLGLHENDRNFEIAKRENAVIFLEDDYQQTYDGFDPNNPESAISLMLMQETYLEQSIVAANTIQKSFVKNLNRKDRTVKQAGFLVLRNTYMPSVLVETGFLTNPTEGAFLNSDKGRIQMAKAIASAILQYRTDLQNSVQNNPIYEVLPDLVDERIETPEVVKKPTISESVTFRIQIEAGKNSIETSPKNFRGLRGVYKEEKDKIFRYYYGKTDRFKDAEKSLKYVRRKGYKSAFIVAFKGGVKINLTEALKTDH